MRDRSVDASSAPEGRDRPIPRDRKVGQLGAFLRSADRSRLWGALPAKSLAWVSVAFNPDGSRFASAGNKSIVMWDTSSEQPVGAPFTYQEEQFVQVAFSISGKVLAASTDAYGGHPSSVILWDVASRQPIGNRSKDPTLPSARMTLCWRYPDITNSFSMAFAPIACAHDLSPATPRIFVRLRSAGVRRSWLPGPKTTRLWFGMSKATPAGYVGRPLSDRNQFAV